MGGVGEEEPDLALREAVAQGGAEGGAGEAPALDGADGGERLAEPAAAALAVINGCAFSVRAERGGGVGALGRDEVACAHAPVMWLQGVAGE